MSAYLQRLYDATAGTAVALEARPAQRSSSPLLAVDQRLASPAYVASFLLGLPGSADPDLDAAPPEPDLLTPPEPTRRAPSPAPEEGSAPLPPSPHVLPSTPEPQPQDQTRVVSPRDPGAAAEPTVRPAAEPRETPPAPRPETHDSRPAAEPARPPAQARRGVIEEPLPSADRRPVPPVERQPQQQAVEPARRQRPARVRVVPDEPPLPERQRTRPEHATPPPMLRPTPANAAEPLPPPAPRVADQTDLADQVRRLVREAMMDGGSVRRGSHDQPDVTGTPRDSDQGGTPSPARTAEAMSVIGPLGRPDRATTLYGLRLR